MESRFAVVRLDRKYADYTFSIWHETFEEAKEEADRLCKKEKAEFCVIQEVAICEIEQVPVVWTSCHDQRKEENIATLSKIIDKVK